MYECMDVCMDVCMHVSMYLCIYVSIYIIYVKCIELHTQVRKIEGTAFIANLASVTEEKPGPLWFHQLCMSGGIHYGFAQKRDIPQSHGFVIIFPIVK